MENKGVEAALKYENNRKQGIIDNKYKVSNRFTIETPNGDQITLIGRKEVMKYLGCSGNFFNLKKFKGYKLILIEKWKDYKK